MIAAGLRFGQLGNAAAFQRGGWSPAEAEFTWAIGPRSRLSIPYSAGEGMLTLEVRASPMVAPPAIPAQDLTVVVNGVECGSDRFVRDCVLGFNLRGIAPGKGGRADIEFHHPGAAVPAEHGISSDPRCLGICVRSVVLRWVPAPADFTPRHRPRLLIPDAAVQEAMVRGYTGLAPRELMQRFLSLGHNCEFGLAQRHLENETASLLRFAGIDPIDILAGLECAFAGIDNPAQIRLLQENNVGVQQYLVRCDRYGMQFHSFIAVDSTPEASMLARMTQYLTFLRRQFEESLREARTMFVLHNRGCATDAQVRPFLRALRQWGPNALLYVTADGAQPGSVDQTEANLFHGHIDYLMTQEVPDVINTPAWLSICCNAYRMWRETGGGWD